MTYSDGQHEYTIDSEGREIIVEPPSVLKVSGGPGEPNPYDEYGHCPYDLGVRLIKIKGSLHRCPNCGGYFSVSKNRQVSDKVSR